uniref:sec14 cytosolic factor-like n=1 Tax=Erigeron canadensis TaxID=72917 RepID=UPI001CB9C08A|nr:sec14 cytosolic factor-like [Erigeron canadensis]
MHKFSAIVNWECSNISEVRHNFRMLCSLPPLTLEFVIYLNSIFLWSFWNCSFLFLDYIIHPIYFHSQNSQKMDQHSELKLKQLKECVQKLGSSTEKYGDPTLMRFLIARSMDANKAAKMFVSWQKWRASFVPLGYIPDSQVVDQLDAKKIYLQGLSKDGYPVMVVKVCNHSPAKDQPQFKKFVVHLLDKAIASGFNGKEIGNEKLVCVLDLDQLAYKNVDVRGMITGFQFLQSYYPERLAKCYLLNMPWFFVSVWKVVSRFLEKATLEKIIIVSDEEGKSQFVREVGKDVLPEELGGKAKLVTLQDVVLPSLGFNCHYT